MFLTIGENMDIATTKMSSKGQVVIPAEMRKDLRKGDKLVILRTKDQIIMRKATKMEQQLEEDLEFARRTDEVWKRYEKGEFKKMDFDEFIEEMKKWQK